MIIRPLVVAFLISLVSVASAAPRRGGSERGPRRGLIHPLLDVDPDVEFKELRPFQYKLVRQIEVLKSSGTIKEAAFYFRDLDNGLMMGYGETTPFRPASLLKVPLMFAVFKAAEKNPAMLDRKVPALPPYEFFTTQHFPPAHPVAPGREYTIRELLRAMIVESDNSAMRTLIGTLTNEEYLAIFTDMGLRIPNVRDLDDPVTVREYSAFFRILYNASYLNRDSSQAGLELLAASDFKSALTAGTPPGTVVAHKFGERREADGNYSFHDCGIVYHPKTPYLLCVMTVGPDIDKLDDAIASLSAVAYREVDASSRANDDLVPSRDGRKPGAAPSRNR